MKSNRVFYIGLVCVLAILLWTIGRWVEKRESTELRGSRRGSLANPDVNLSSTQSILSIPNKTEDITFELTKPLTFANNIEKKSITKADIQTLRDLPVDMGENDTDGVTLTNLFFSSLEQRLIPPEFH